MRVAIDAAGGDEGSSIIVPGAVAGARKFAVGLILAGPEAELRQALAQLDTSGLDIEIRDAPELIEMTESAIQSVRRKPRSGINVALDAVRAGDAGAMVSAGHSGAVLTASLMKLGRTHGVERPALAAALPSRSGLTLVLDLGAITDPKPRHLVQFARMGVVYCQRVMNIPNPTVGLLSNGEESSKGNTLAREAHQLLSIAPGVNFYGNIEGSEITRGVVDVVVTDGFTGNVALKVAEGVASFTAGLIRDEVTSSPLRKLAAALLRPAFAAVRTKLDYSETGGALLLGVNGMVVVSHGRSNANAIANAIGAARRGADCQVTSAIAEAIAAAPPPEPLLVAEVAT